MRSLFARLLLMMCGIAAGSTVLALLLQERSLSSDLEAAAAVRLAKAATAAERLLEDRLATMAERYAAISGTPQFRATLEVNDAPTLAHYAETLLEQQQAARVAFLAPGDRVVAAAGSVDADAAAAAVGEAGLISQAGSAFAVVSTPLGRAGRLVAVEEIEAQTLTRWSELCGAQVSFGPASAPRSEDMVRTVREVDGFELRVTSSLRAEQLAMGHARWNLAAAGALALTAAFAVSLLASRGLVRPIIELKRAAERIGAGDLTVEIRSERRDEIGDVSRAFLAMARGLRGTAGQVVQAADRVEATASTILECTSRLATATQEQTRGNAETTAALARINVQVGDIAGSAAQSSGTLEQAVDGSSSSFKKLAASGEALNRNASALWQQTEEIASSIEQMIQGSIQVAKCTESVLPAVEETAARTVQMESTTRAVNAHAEETARLSERVVQASENGRRLVSETLTGMEMIRKSTADVQETIRTLRQRGQEIGTIVTVIDDVTDETGLLALNASIIAAQAGEHGRSFAIVANQMKALAERVTAGTREIGGLVRAVQEGSAGAVAAIESGSARVEQGVSLARQAEASLEDITRAARESGDRMRDSVDAGDAQQSAAAAVVEQIEQVKEGVEVIRDASFEQQRGNDSVRESSEVLRRVAQHVQETIASQAQGAARIAESIETVQSTVVEITARLQEQVEACRQAGEAIGHSQAHVRTNEDSAGVMGEAAGELEREAELLREAVKRFRL